MKLLLIQVFFNIGWTPVINLAHIHVQGLYKSDENPWKKKEYLCQQTFIWKKIEDDFVITGTAPISAHFAWISVFGAAASDTLKHTSSNLTKPLPQSASKS